MNNTCNPQPLFFSLKKEWLVIASGTLLSVILASVVLTGWPEGLIPNFTTPYLYSGDGLSYSWQLQRAIEGWVFTNNRVGYPFHSNFYDYPGSDAGNLFIAKIFGFFFNSYVVSYNAYILLSFALVFLISYAVCRSFNFDTLISFAIAILYTFASFHFTRLGHLFFLMYFCAPLYYYFGYKIYINALSLKNIALPALCLFVLASFGVYYALFGLLIIAFAMLVSYFNSTKFNSLYPGCILIIAVIMGVIFNIAPNFYYTFIHGANNEVAVRSSGEAEIFGLKWMQLIIPQQTHQISSFARFALSYIAKTPLNNENTTSSLGFFAALGFVMIWVGLFLKFTRNKFTPFTNYIIMTVVMLFMFGTVGGFGSLFSVLISSSIRGWNRISIFIQFGSLLFFFIILGAILTKYKVSRKYVAAVITIITVIGCFDQTPNNYNINTMDAKKNYLLDSSFIKKIEGELPQGSAIYQLPYMPFPEVPHLHDLETYALASGFLNSTSLKWSYAGMKGREGDIFYRHLSELPADQQIKAIKNLGFAGIYIDRRGYEDQGQEVVAQFMKLLPDAKVIVRSDNNIVFISLPTIKKVDFTGMTDQDIIKSSGLYIDRLGVRYHATPAEGIDFSRKEWPDFIADVSGLSVPEAWGRWSDGKTITFKLNEPITGNIEMEFKGSGFAANVNQISHLQIGDQVIDFTLQPEIKTYHFKTKLTKPSNSIVFIPYKAVSPAELGLNGDNRKLGIGFVDLKIKQIN